MRVPFLDLKTQYNTIQDEIAEAIQQVLDKTAFAGGPFVAQFEKDFADFCQCQYGLGVGSGTEALWMALLALGIGPGDEVITVPNTFIATAEAISFTGAKPIFVDIDETTYTMEPQKLEDFLKIRSSKSEIGNVKAIIPVHLFGQMADMDPIMEIAREYNLFVIEDACQAHGAEYKSKRAGSIGDVGCFSFYPGKNLGAYGEAGAVVTNNEEVDRKIRMLRDHGQSKKYYHDMVGWNARMDGFQGAILSVKLKYIQEWNNARRKNAKLYKELLAKIDDIITPEEAEYAKHVYHIYPIRVKNRDGLMEFLSEKEIYTGIHYPILVHLTAAYKPLDLEKGNLPIAEGCANEFLSLPMFPELTENQIKFVAQKIEYYETKNNEA